MIGLRTFKTAVAVASCLLLYTLFVPNWQYIGPFYACIAAVISLQPTTEKTKKVAQNRVIGTVIGGLYSALLFTLYAGLGIELLNFIFVFCGIIAVIVTCNKFGFNSGISTGCIVLIGAFTLDFSTSPLLHAMFRTIDTTIGVVIAYYINLWLPGGDSTTL